MPQPGKHPSVRRPAVFTALYHAEAVDTLARFLRAHHVFRDDDLSLPHGAGLPAIYERLQQALERLRAPPVPFLLPANLRPIDSVHALRQLGVQFKNCLCETGGIRYWLGLADGSDVFLASEAPPFLAVLTRVGPELWTLGEISGPNNGRVTDVAIEELTATLRGVGVQLVADDPAEMVRRLAHEIRGRHGGAAMGLPHDGEWLAA